MKRRLATAALLALFPLSVALAQSWQPTVGQGRLVQQGTGFTFWWVENGVKRQVAYDHLTRAELDALPSGEPLDAFLLPAVAPTATAEPTPEPVPTDVPAPEPTATTAPTPEALTCAQHYLQDAYTWSPALGLLADWSVDNRAEASLVNLGQALGQPIGALRLTPAAGWATYGRQFCTRMAFLVEGTVEGEAVDSTAILDLPGLLPAPLRLAGGSKYGFYIKSVPLSDGELAQQVEVTVTVDGRLWSRETLQIQSHAFGLRLAAEGDAVAWGPLGFEGVPLE